jgi:hypothetical protein
MQAVAVAERDEAFGAPHLLGNGPEIIARGGWDGVVDRRFSANRSCPDLAPVNLKSSAATGFKIDPSADRFACAPLTLTSRGHVGSFTHVQSE